LTAEKVNPLKIGSLHLVNPLLLAPLSGISDLPFRLLAKEQGCALVSAEMISAEGIVRNRKSAQRPLKSCPEERPLAVQIMGSEPKVMAEAAKMIEGLGADLLDINMGCPAKKVIRGGSGAALLKDLRRAKEIIQAVRQGVSVPVTVKMRLGWDEKNLNFLELGRIAEDCGINALTLHGRTRTQGYAVQADWEVITRAKENLHIPIIGNGDLTSAEAVVNFFSRTGCAGAMVGRGALGNPWIFREALKALEGQASPKPSLQEKEEVILRHLHMMVELNGEKHGLPEFRKHLIWYTRGLPGSAEFRSRISQWNTVPAVTANIRIYFYGLQGPLLLSKQKT